MRMRKWREQPQDSVGIGTHEVNHLEKRKKEKRVRLSQKALTSDTIVRVSVSKRKFLQDVVLFICSHTLVGHDVIVALLSSGEALQETSSEQIQEGLAENIVILFVLKQTIRLIMCTTTFSRHWKRPHPPISLMMSSAFTGLFILV